MVQDAAYDGVLGDEREDFHLGTATTTGQGVSLIDAVDSSAHRFHTAQRCGLGSSSSASESTGDAC